MTPVVRWTRGFPALCRWGAAGAVAVALAAGGCSATIADLPEPAQQGAAQARTVRDFPAVHDVPPSRTDPTLTDAEQIKVQEELKAASQAQPARIEEIEREAKPPPPPPPPSRPAATPRRQAAGSRQNP